MKGRIWSIPYGMVFLKHYCHKCGSRLKKEKTTRIVTKEDVDYYYYHDRGTFPRSDVIVNEYIYSCPHCKNKISYTEQKKYSYIQKKLKKKVLCEKDILNELEYANRKYNLSSKISSLLFLIFATLFTGSIFYITREEKGIINYFKSIAIVFVIIVLITFLNRILFRKKHKQEDIDLYTKMYTIALNNKELIETSEKCYCFHCLKEFPSSEIEAFRDDKSALCPYCEMKSVIPDNASVEVTEELLKETKDYWF